MVQIDSIKYYAPFTLPKSKHQSMKNGKDFRKIAGGKLGAINFNNMIPVPDHVIKLIDIEKEPDVKYRTLLRNQYKAIRKDAPAIKNTASDLRNLVLADDDNLGEYDRSVKARCCNLRLLESIYLKYGQCATEKSVNINEVAANIPSLNNFKHRR